MKNTLQKKCEGMISSDWERGGEERESFNQTSAARSRRQF